MLNHSILASIAMFTFLWIKAKITNTKCSKTTSMTDLSIYGFEVSMTAKNRRIFHKQEMFYICS